MRPTLESVPLEQADAVVMSLWSDPTERRGEPNGGDRLLLIEEGL